MEWKQLRIVEAIQHGGETQSKQLRDNAEDVLGSNLKMLHRLLGIALLVLLFCLCASILSPADYGQRRPAYIICLACTLGLCLVFAFRRAGRYALVGLYCIFSVFLGLTIFLSVVVSPTVMATSIIGIYCLMPLAILDKNWRVNLFTLLAFGAHTAFAWVLKLPKAAIDDMLNGIVFIMIGTLFGGFMRSVKLENYDIKRQMQRQSDVDFLTGLFNRRKMFELLEQQRTSKSAVPILGIIMLDIDHFKDYNDRFGHVAGDECLRRLGAGFQEFGESCGMEFFRYGGEEFLAFCHGTDVGTKAEELRRLVWDMALPFPGSQQGRVTVSLGFAAVDQAGGLVNEQLIMMADKALYKAKESGRNRAVPFLA